MRMLDNDPSGVPVEREISMKAGWLRRSFADQFEPYKGGYKFCRIKDGRKPIE